MMYNACVIGGGIAGLAFALDLRARGYSVVLIEKGSYPRHKVCGEYISMESYNYLISICPSLAKINFPVINNFQLSSTSKKIFKTRLTLGGFGVSRYLLEQLLSEEAITRGITFMTKTKVHNIGSISSGSGYVIDIGMKKIKAQLVINATGRKSNITEHKKNSRTNYVGVKYHVKIKRDPALIEIHNFPGGYCGISNIEDEKSCLCYMINSKQIVRSNNSIRETESRFLWQNKYLKKIFNEAEFIFEEPVTTSGISFLIKQPVAHGIFYLGDAAGSIAPLTGNGMSMGLRSAYLLAGLCGNYFSGMFDKEELMNNYSLKWKGEFETRIKLSRYFQNLSEYTVLTKVTINLFDKFPMLAEYAIKQTHGQPF
ncbi:MAG: NAD(P)/FAD-dependent oxidoreductase [Bacteroidia bacterium]